MKELTKKILEAGLVDKTIAQCLEMWHLLTPEEAALAARPLPVVEALAKFIENLEELLEQEPGDEITDKPMRETRLEISVKKPPVSYWYRPAMRAKYTALIWACEDEMGRLVVGPESEIYPGGILSPSDPGPAFLVLEVDDLYQGNVLVAKQVTLDPSPK